MPDTLGFIGFGIMGRPMALNLIKGGYKLNVYARRQASTAPFKHFAAVICDSPQQLAERSDIIFTVLTDTKAVEQIVLGPQGILSGAKTGSVVIDMSSIAPDATRQMAATLHQRQVDMLDAPVSGGEAGAKDGSLAIMVGGKPAVFRRMKPILQMMGHCTYVGPHGCGQIAKACNQALITQFTTAVAEVLLLAKAAGADPGKVRAAMLDGFAHSKALDAHGQRMLNGDFKAGFKAKLHAKDLSIVRRLAEQSGIRLSVMEAAAQMMEALAESNGELDSSSVLKILEQRMGIKLCDSENKSVSKK